MSPLPPTARLFLRWMLPGMLGGLLVGGGATWWAMRRSVEGEARRLAGAMAEEAAGPQAPAPPAGGGGRAGSGKAGPAAGTAAVPVIGVTDNLEESFKELLAIADPSVRQAALLKFLEALPVDRWPAFFVSGRKMGDRGEFDDYPGGGLAALGVLETALSFMMKRSPEGLLDGVAGAPAGAEGGDADGRDDGMVASALRFWAGHDLPGAMAYFEKNLRSLPPEKHAEAAKGLAREYVKKDPAAAFVWIKGLPKENQAQVAHGALQTLSHTDSEAALRFLVSEKELPNREQFAGQIAMGWAATKPEEALAWAKGLPEELSPRAVQGAMGHLAEKDFAAALKEVAVLTPAQQDAAMEALAGNVTSDPSRVSGLLQLVEQAPEGPGRASAASSTLQKWTEADPEAASAWVAAQPDGLTRDAAIQGFGYAAVASKKNPEAGLEWTAAMSDPGARKDSLCHNVVVWAGFDAEAARAWVQSSPRLSDADREVLLPMTRK